MSNVWGEEAPATRSWARARPRWVLSGAAYGGVIAALILFTLSLLARRPDVAALGLAAGLGVAWRLARPPGVEPRGELVSPDQDGTDQRQSGRLTAVLDLTGSGEPAGGSAGAVEQGSQLAVRVSAPGHRPVEAVLATRLDPRRVTVAITSVHTGRRPLFQLDQRAGDAQSLLLAAVASHQPLVVTVLPGTRELRELPLPFRLQGMTGPHNSRRAGDGGELHDINQFTPGARLRRIDWRVTARSNTGPATVRPDGRLVPMINTLYVRRTTATADATVMLVVDPRDDVGPRVASWGDATDIREDEATSLDIARFAAASMARHYLHGGDRVGLEDLGRMDRPVPPAGGRRQLQRLTRQLAIAQPHGEPKPRQRVPRLPSGALIVAFSTFLDDDVARMASIWRHGGHRVVAVDVLPTLDFIGLGDRAGTAYRIVAMERQDRIRRLAHAGVETFRWDDRAADPALSLLAMARDRRAG